MKILGKELNKQIEYAFVPILKFACCNVNIHVKIEIRLNQSIYLNHSYFTIFRRLWARRPNIRNMGGGRGEWLVAGRDGQGRGMIVKRTIIQQQFEIKINIVI